MKAILNRIKQWLDSPVGGWDKYWKQQTGQYSKFAQESVHAAVQSYLIKWMMYYHQTKEYDTNACLTLEKKVTEFLEETCRNLCK